MSTAGGVTDRRQEAAWEGGEERHVQKVWKYHNL